MPGVGVVFNLFLNNVAVPHYWRDTCQVRPLCTLQENELKWFIVWMTCLPELASCDLAQEITLEVLVNNV